MPLWTIHHSPGIFSAEDKRNFAERITAHYAQIGLPRFYVIVIFTETNAENFYVGGESTSSGVRIVIDHIARHAPDQAGRQRTTRWIQAIVTPFLERDSNLHWEFHVDDTSEDLWMINGLVPPPGGSDIEKSWAQANTVVAYP